MLLLLKLLINTVLHQTNNLILYWFDQIFGLKPGRNPYCIYGCIILIGFDKTLLVCKQLALI